MDEAIQEESLLWLGIKYKPANRCEVTTYLNTEKNESNMFVETAKEYRGREELLNKKWSKVN